jgi:serine/threonine-protein phosphatase PP1-1
MGEPVPQPGPARISKGGGPDEWLEMARQCKYLPESDMKRLCEMVKECLMEGTSMSSTTSL